MDDARTHETLEALADLFLTGTDPAAVPVMRHDVTEQLNGPAPMRLGPKRVPPRPRRPEPGDQGPRLRLHRGDDHPESADDPTQVAAAPDSSFEVDPAPIEAVVEATLLGNLPGFGGPWLTQYAQLLADEHGPVVILHVDSERIDAELVQPGGSNALSGFEFIATTEHTEGQLPIVQMLNVLLRLQPTPVRMLLVNHLSITDGDAIRRLGSMKLWTLLTGADDMATVAAYRTLKQVMEGSLAGPLPGSVPAGVGLMVMGSDEAASRTAAAKINATASEFLKAPAPLVGHLQRMGPVNVKQLGSFAYTAEAWSALTALFDTVMPRLPTFVQTPSQTPEVAPSVDTVPEPVAQPVEVKIKPRVADSVRPPRLKPRPIETKVKLPPDDWSPFDDAPRMKPRREVSATPTEVAAPVAKAKTQAAPDAKRVEHAPARQIAPITTEDDPDLVAVLLNATGGAIEGVALEARCPRHGGVQFLLDATGQLHLLKRHCFDRDGNGDGVRAALLELIETEAWTREHRQLIALASRPHPLNSAARPRLHLFTDRADLVTPMIGRTDLPLKLHLLQEVELPTGSAWYCTALS